MPNYKMVLTVSGALVSTIFDLLKDDGVVIMIEPIEDNTKQQKRRPHRSTQYVNGVKNKGISGEELVLKVLSDGERWAVKDIAKSFEASGFAWNSCNSVLSKLKLNGKIAYVGPKTYQLKN